MTVFGARCVSMVLMLLNDHHGGDDDDDDDADNGVDVDNDHFDGAESRKLATTFQKRNPVLSI